MGRRTRRRYEGDPKSQTLPSSPTRSFSSSSSSSSDFEFTISLSPRNKSGTCPADELFYKGQLLPLSLSPRLSMVQTLLLASSSISSSSDSASTTSPRDSTDSSGSSSSTESSCRPSSVNEDDEFKRLNQCFPEIPVTQIKKSSKYFSLLRFSSVFKKNPRDTSEVPIGVSVSVSSNTNGSSSVKKAGVSAKEVFRRYFKKVKPLYEKLSSQKQQETVQGSAIMKDLVSKTVAKKESTNTGILFSHSFSGNLRYPRKQSMATSCPSSIRSSPSHSGVLNRFGVAATIGTSSTSGGAGSGATNVGCSESSSMEELQSAIQGAIAHCKNSMVVQNKR